MASFDDLEDELGGLGDRMADAASLTSAFSGELDRVRGALTQTSYDIGTLEKGMSRGLRKAFDGVVFDGFRLGDALKTLSTTLADTAYAAAIKPITDGFGSAIANGVGGLMEGILPFAAGGSFTQGRVMPFAKGGVVSSPTTFPMRGATGLMGEAGPEAIMPLTRGSDGSLGVRAQGGGGVAITMNISTPDVAGFQRSQGQIAAQMNRALERGRRNS